MPTLRIADASPHHCGAIIRRLRRDHLGALATIGIDTHRELRNTFDRSYLRKVGFIDDRLIGLGGIVGTFMSGSGFVWLCLTDEASKYPFLVLRELRRQLDAVMTMKAELVTKVPLGDPKALRLCTWLGFNVGEPKMGEPLVPFVLGGAK